MPQRSVLLPILLVIFVNDIVECGINVDAFKFFADDTKAGNKVPIATLQECIDRMSEGGNGWQMQFNANKCKAIHKRHGNP